MELNTNIKQENTYYVKQEDGENTTNDNNEIYIMNYEEDYEYEENVAEFIKKEVQEVNIHEEITNDMYANTKLEIEEQKLCDVVVKKEILESFHKNSSNPGKNRREDNTFNGRDGINTMPYQRKKYIDMINDPSRTLCCAECGFKAAKKHHLASHIQQAHSKSRPPKKTLFECDHCMFSTRHQSNLIVHISSFHLDEIEQGDLKAKKKKSCYDVRGLQIKDHSTFGNDGIYSCSYCSFTSPNKSITRQHIARHVVEKKPVKQCPYCPLRYIAVVLNVHIQKAHNPEGVFKCSKCYYVTKFRGNLRRHTRRNEKLETCAPTQKRKTSIFQIKNEKESKKKDTDKK